MGRKFPTFAFVVLVLGLLWLAVEIRWITIPIPWFPSSWSSLQQAG